MAYAFLFVGSVTWINKGLVVVQIYFESKDRKTTLTNAERCQ